MAVDEMQEREWSAWMAAAQTGDRAAYERLLRAVTPFIRAIARRQHRNPDRVEDVVQDVLLTIHRVRQTYDPARPFMVWLATITKRRSIDALRRHMRTDRFEINNDLAYETFADAGANKTIEQHETEAMVSAAMANLPEGQRQSFTLLKLQGLSLNEAARISGQSVGSLKVSVHRAVKALQALLNGSVSHD